MRWFWDGNFVAVVAIIGWIIVTVTKIVSRNRVREMELRERIAMIERGLVPPPEVDPAGFDRVMARVDRFDQGALRRPGRHRRAAVLMIGVGFGLMLLIGLTANESPGTAVGVGGFLVILGIAFFVNSLSEPYREDRPSTRRERPVQPTPTDPPK